MSWAICGMSKVSGARYSTATPVSSCAWSTPFLTTDQKGSAADPCVTTTIRMSPRSGASWATPKLARRRRAPRA
jgi:hypothetical protein